MPRKLDTAKDPQHLVHQKEALTSPQRYEKLDPQRVVSLLPLLPYHVVADVGCGPGFFTIPLAKYLFDGKVHAMDVQQGMLDATKKEVERVNLTNVELHLAEENRLPLEDESVDGAFAAFVIHEVEDKLALLKEIRRCVRRGGWLALLEWHKRNTEDGPPPEMRLDEAELRDVAQQAGFRLASQHILNDDQYMLLMRK
jgi:ubiquinone/menaquinone biosynthesis C-methylase UbiE